MIILAIEISFSTAVSLFFSLILAIIFAALLIVLNRYRRAKKTKTGKEIYRYIFKEFKTEELTTENIKKNKHLKNVKAFEDQYINSRQTLTSEIIENKAIEYFRITKSLKRHISNLNSINKYKKIRATVFLGTINLPEVVRALEVQLQEEKNYTYKMYIADAISNLKSSNSLPVLINSLLGAPEWYRKKTHSFISNFEYKFMPFFSELRKRSEFEIVEMNIYFASSFEAEELKEYLLEKSLSTDENIALKASKALQNKYHYYLNSPEYLQNKNTEIRNIAIEALETLPTKKSIISLIPFLEIEETAIQTVSSISNILKKKPYLIDFIASKFHETENINIKNGLTSVLANRIEYYLVNIVSREKKYIKILIQEIIINQKLSQIIGFLNKNKNRAIEKEVLQVISKLVNGNKIIKNIDPVNSLNFLSGINSDELRGEIIKKVIAIENLAIEFSQENEQEKITKIKNYLRETKPEELNKELLSTLLRIYLKYQFRTYLQAHILAKIDLTQYKPPRKRKEEEVEQDKIILLKKILVSLILFFPLLFIARHISQFSETSAMDLFKIYVIDFNYYLVFYSFSINSIYILLLFFSFLGVKQQANFWELKKRSFLFKKDILPSISILAPAYGEQETIKESVNSLLNLEYPDYELIVINDGSPDNTLNVLIDYFNLEKVDKPIDIKLKAQPITGVYVNKNISKLIVVDKVNGGKADALNVGINVAEKEFFCGIDSDSLLESEALTKLISQSLDDDKESVALGGNIFPINGCKVHKGKLEEMHIPTDRLARLQTIEYLRAFMAGRIGWAYINSLLIISGAFGLFSKARVIEIGGYLTSSERYKKDTVGEDMELVVRISRHMNEIGEKFAVHYAYNANCWTEVPEELKMLRNQRDRWQRGLIDILNFHKPLVFSPKYGKMGTVGFPYFFIFEVIGPLVEMKGYFMLLIALLLGTMDNLLALLLFTTSIVMGILVSISSLLVAEQETHYFSIKDLSILVWYALIENFGPRQVASYWRVKGYFSSLKKPKGWGEMARKVKTTVLTVVTNNQREEDLKNRFEKMGFKVLCCQDSKSAMEMIKQENIHLVISQYNLPKATAANLRREMLTFESKKDIPFLVFSDKLEKTISKKEMEETNIGEFKNEMDDKELQALIKS